MAHGLTPAPTPFSLYHIAGSKYLSPFTDPFTGKMLVLEEEPVLGAPSLSMGPCPQAQASPRLGCWLCAPPATGQSSHVCVLFPGPPPRQHLAPAAGWRGWRCPQCWRLGRCRPRSCLAPPSGSSASRSAPRVRVGEEGPLCLPRPRRASDPALPRLASRGRQRAGLREANAKPLLRPVSQPPGLQPRSQATTCLTLYLAHPVQPWDSPAPDSGPGRGPVLGASKSHEVGGCRGPRNAGSQAPVPALPAPGEASPGIEGALQGERRQGLPEGPSAQRAASEDQRGRSGPQPSAHQPTSFIGIPNPGPPCLLHPGPSKDAQAHSPTGLQSWLGS